MASRPRRLTKIALRLLSQGRLTWTFRRKLRNRLFPFGADTRNVLEQPYIHSVELGGGNFSSTTEFDGVREVLVSSYHEASSWVEAIRSLSLPARSRIRIVTMNQLAEVGVSKAVIWVNDPVRLEVGFLNHVCNFDEDRVAGVYFDGLVQTVHGIRPVYRPAYSPILLSAANYIGPVAVVSPVLLGAFLRSLPGCYEKVRLEDYINWTVGHDLPWVKGPGFPYQSLDNEAPWTLRSKALEGQQLAGSGMVDVIIPSKNPDLIERCLAAVSMAMDFDSLSIWVVANGNHRADVASVAMRYPNIHIIIDENPFNWSRVNNEACRSGTSKFLVFLNDDVIVEPNWISVIRQYLQLPKIGVVGAKLLYDTGEVQHGGVCSPSPGVWVHRFQFLERHELGYMGLLQLPQEVSAVTGALLATRRDVFDTLEGFDERYALAYNDLDYCLRTWRIGKSVLYLPDCIGVHHESTTRRRQAEPESQKIFLSEWGSYIDPYFPKGLTRFYGSPVLNEEGLDL